MSYQIKELETNEVTLETKHLRRAQQAVVAAYCAGRRAVILMTLENGKQLIMSKMSEVAQ